MAHLTMCPLKISKMRKRLSDTSYLLQINCLAIIVVLLGILILFRMITARWDYGLVSAELPSLAIREGTQEDAAKLLPRATITKTTPTVVMTEGGFFYGDLAAFADGFDAVRNKFFLEHTDRTPQLGLLTERMDEWYRHKARKVSQANQGLLVLLPSGDIPMPIVIQVMDSLKSLWFVDEVVLGGGLL